MAFSKSALNKFHQQLLNKIEALYSDSKKKV